MIPRHSHQTTCQVAKPLALLSSWRPARFSPVILTSPYHLYGLFRFSKRNRAWHPSAKPWALRPKALNSSGQALVALLAFMAMSIVLTSAATVVTLTNAHTSSKYSLGQEALRVAEAGADNALLRLLRDPNYAGETLTVGTGTATITVSGSGTKTIVSEGVSSSFRRRVQVTATYASRSEEHTSE